MKIRLMGLSAEVTRTLQVIRQIRTFDVIQVSGPYPDRGGSRLVRVYIEAQLHPDSGAVP